MIAIYIQLNSIIEHLCLYTLIPFREQSQPRASPAPTWKSFDELYYEGIQFYLNLLSSNFALLFSKLNADKSISFISYSNKMFFSSMVIDSAT